MRWRWLIPLGLAVAAAGCGGAQRAPDSQPAQAAERSDQASGESAPDLLVLAAAAGITALDPDGTTRRLPLGVLSPDSRVLYTTHLEPGGTLVEAVDVSSGTVLASRSIPGSFGLPVVAEDGTLGGLSHDGGTLVLEETHGAGRRHTTQFQVLATSLTQAPRSIELRGGRGQRWASAPLTPIVHA